MRDVCVPWIGPDRWVGSSHYCALRFTEQEMSWKFLESLRLRREPKFTSRPHVNTYYLT